MTYIDERSVFFKDYSSKYVKLINFITQSRFIHNVRKNYESDVHFYQLVRTAKY